MINKTIDKPGNPCILSWDNIPKRYIEYDDIKKMFPDVDINADIYQTLRTNLTYNNVMSLIKKYERYMIRNNSIYKNLFHDKIWKILFNIDYGKLYLEEHKLKNLRLNSHENKWFNLYNMRTIFFNKMMIKTPCLTIMYTNRKKFVYYDNHISIAVKDSISPDKKYIYEHDYIILNSDLNNLIVWEFDKVGQIHINKYYEHHHDKPYKIDHHHHHQHHHRRHHHHHHNIVNDYEDDIKVKLNLLSYAHNVRIFSLSNINMGNLNDMSCFAIISYENIKSHKSKNKHNHKRNKHCSKYRKYTTKNMDTFINNTFITEIYILNQDRIKEGIGKKRINLKRAFPRDFRVFHISNISNDNEGNHYVGIGRYLFKWNQLNTHENINHFFAFERSIIINIEVIDYSYLMCSCLDISECRSLSYKIKLVNINKRKCVGVIYDIILTNPLPIRELDIYNDIVRFGYVVFVRDPYKNIIFFDLRDASRYMVFQLNEGLYNTNDKMMMATVKSSLICYDIMYLISSSIIIIYKTNRKNNSIYIYHFDGKYMNMMHSFKLSDLLNENLLPNDTHVRFYYKDMKLHVLIDNKLKEHIILLLMDYDYIYKLIECTDIKERVWL